MPISFRFRWLPFCAALLLAVPGIALGNWQGERARYKEAQAARQEQMAIAPPLVLGTAPLPPMDELEYRRISVRGEFVRDWAVYLENRPHQGMPGFYVFMPFRLSGSTRHLLVMRGWVPRDSADRTRVPALATPAGEIELVGLARRDPGRLLQLGSAAAIRPGALLQNLDIGQFAKASGMELLPFVLQQDSDSGDGLLRDWPRPEAGADRNRGYAFQWYALAATAGIFFMVTGFRRARK